MVYQKHTSPPFVTIWIISGINPRPCLISPSGSGGREQVRSLSALMEGS